MRPINTIDFTNPIRPRIRKKLVWRKDFGQSEWCFDLCLEPGGSFGACRASTQCILVRPRAGAGTAARRPYHCRRKLSQQRRSAEVDSCPFAEDGRASFVCHVRATASRWNSTIQLSALPISCEGGWAMTLGSQRIQWMEFMPADNSAPRGSSIGIECHRCCRGNLRDVPKHPTATTLWSSKGSAVAMSFRSPRTRALPPPAAATCLCSMLLARTALRPGELGLGRTIQSTQIRNNH